MKANFLLLYFVVIAIFPSCTKVTGGIVTAKHYEPEHTSIQVAFIYTGKSFVPVPRPVHYDESWTITIRSMAEGKERRRDLRVTQALFERIRIGDFFDASDAGGGL